MSHIRGFFTRTPADSERRRGRVVTVTLVGTLGTLGLLLLAPCALALPEGRVYEMVSPPYKGGYSAKQVVAVAPDGESVAFFSTGVFAGAPAGFNLIDYVARRGSSGWSTVPVTTPATLAPYVAGQDVSSSLGATLDLGKPGPNSEATFHEGTEEEIFLHATAAPDTDANWEAGGPVLKALDEKPLAVTYQGASADLCRLFLAKSGSPLLPEALETKDQQGLLYELDRGCGGEPALLRLVGLNNQGKLLNPSCEVDLGIGADGGSGHENTFNAIADGGREVFFTTGLEKGGCSNGPTGTHQLFVRLDGSRTLEVSKPLGEVCGEVPCASAASRKSADFVGAAGDGSRVLFTTTGSLVSEDKDSTSDVYMARIGCPEGEPGCEVAQREVTSLVLVSHDSAVGQAAEVQGVVRVASDGSRVYFVARGVLGEGANAQGQVPVAGADNLYVYDDVSGRTAFVTDLCSGPGLSGPGGSLQTGAVADGRCPSSLDTTDGGRNDARLWSSDAGEVQTAGGDGRFLVFSSYGQLVGGDTDTAKDVYRYDAVTGALDRVSLGEGGFDANGNSNAFKGNIGAVDATIPTAQLTGNSVREQYEMGTRAASEDGSRIVFTSSEPLAGGAINGLANVYEWHEEPGWGEGKVSLVSSGSGVDPVEQVVISPAGNDVFFVTTQGLQAQDTDGEGDIYDARLNGGFSPAPALPRECSGDACQGSLTNPAPLLVPGSVSQAPGEDFPAARAKKALKAKRHKAKKRAGKRKKKTRAKKAATNGKGR